MQSIPVIVLRGKREAWVMAKLEIEMQALSFDGLLPK